MKVIKTIVTVISIPAFILGVATGAIAENVMWMQAEKVIKAAADKEAERIKNQA